MTLYAIFLARVLGVMLAICPCAPKERNCQANRAEAAAVITFVALDDADPVAAAGILLGTAKHETGFQTEVQNRGGPARSFWQVEVRKAERAEMLADRYKAARHALRIARTCRGSYLGYASGRCFVTGKNSWRIKKNAKALQGNVWRASQLLANTAR